MLTLFAVWPNVEPLNTGWLYSERKDAPATEWQPVTLPHTWNAADTLDTVKYRRGVSWYQRTLPLTKEDLQHRMFLRFGAAGQEAKVFVNDKPAGEHIGGYAAFTVELTRHLRVGKNTVLVEVSNAPSRLCVPIGDGLFNLYGGLYRGAQLIRAPKVCFQRDHRGGPGVRVWSDTVSAKEADVQVLAQIDGTNVTVSAELADPAGKIVAKATGKTGRLTLPKVKRPQLWSPEKPVLYTLTVRLLRGGQELDRAVVRHGFRWFEFTTDRGFFLNGKPYKLRGVNRHQDVRGPGNAVGPEWHEKDLLWMKEIGANWLRLAHYQQDDFVLQRCDELGLLVWEEIPFVRDTNLDPVFERNVQTQLVEMIEQHFNHPCVILWGLGNEIWFQKGADGRAREFGLIQRLHETVRREDPRRKSVIVSGDANTFSNLKIMTIPDVIGYNLYLGWYGNNVKNLTARVEDLHRRDPSKPFIVSEFGAGCDPWIHAETPKMFDQSQEYQVFFLESYLKQLDAIPWLSGYNWWSFADFGWAQSKVPPFYNNKGFVTWDRQAKKDSFYAVKAHWTNEPVLWLCSPSWTNRTGIAEKKYRVITNLKSVELFQNGKSLGAQMNGFVWPVTLQPGANQLRAISGELSHGFTVTFTPKVAATNQPAAKDVNLDHYNPFKDQKK